MNTSVERTSPPSPTAAHPEPPPAGTLHRSDNWVQKISELGFAKSFGIGAVVISFIGWLIHSYATPAASSVWHEMIRPRVDNFIVDGIQRSPRIHDFMVTEINGYFSGTIPSLEKKPNDLGTKLKTLANSSETIEAISNSLFGNVDSVYTIAADYYLEQIKDNAANTVAIVAMEPKAGPVRLLAYADPNQHCIWAFVQTRGQLQRGGRMERLHFAIKLNDSILRDGDNVSVFAHEIGAFIRKRQGTGGGGKDEEEDVASSLSQNIQKIDIVPQFPTFDPIKIVGSPDNVPAKEPAIVSINGYVLITRRRAENQFNDCKQNAIPVSSSNGSR
jgi:hypothetical protein